MTRNIDEPTRIALTITMVALLLAGSPLTGSSIAASGPTIEQSPIEFSAQTSGDHHVEVVFEGPIRTADYEFSVVTAHGDVVASNGDINRGLTNETTGQVTFDLGKTDLTDGAVLRIESETVQRDVSIRTTAGTVQADYSTDYEIQPGESIALVDIYHENQYYEIRDASGNIVTNGTVGSASYVTAVDTTGWDDDTTYAVQFGQKSTIREFSVEADPATQGKSSPDGTASLEIHDVTISDTAVRAGEAVTITATFENVGSTSGEFSAWLAYRDLDVIEQHTVSNVAVGERRTVKMTTSFDQYGTHTLRLSGHPVGTVTVNDPGHEQFDERYPHLSYAAWDATIDESALVNSTASPADSA